MKKKIILLVIAVMLTGIMTACGSQGSSSSSSSSSSSADTSVETPVITDLQTSDADVHEEIVPYDAGEDVTQENPYYVRTTDTDGSLVYAVMKADTEEIVYLPVGSTVIYSGDDGDCYYERKTITYKSDGEDRENIQYQLYVRNADSVEDEIRTMGDEISSDEEIQTNETSVETEVESITGTDIPVENAASSETVFNEATSVETASDAEPDTSQS